MASVPNRRRSKRARGAHGEAPVGRYIVNPGSNVTNQGSDPDPADLAWCIRRQWRIIYYTWRANEEGDLWTGAGDFEVLMLDALLRLSSAFKPISPVRRRAVIAKDSPKDWRQDQLVEPASSVYPMPESERRKWGC
jgi:hypothetical protein